MQNNNGRHRNPATNGAALCAAAEVVTRNGAGVRHAIMALRTGRTVEAIVVLEAMETGTHLTVAELSDRTAALHEEMDDRADARDYELLTAAVLSRTLGLPA